MRGHKFYCRSTMLGMVVPIHADSEDERERQARARQEYEERERAKREREEEERRRWSSKAHAVAQCQLAGDVVKVDLAIPQQNYSSVPAIVAQQLIRPMILTITYGGNMFSDKTQTSIEKLLRFVQTGNVDGFFGELEHLARSYQGSDTQKMLRYLQSLKTHGQIMIDVTSGDGSVKKVAIQKLIDEIGRVKCSAFEDILLDLVNNGYYGRSFLNIAAEHGHKAMVEALLELGANPLARCEEEIPCFEVARSKGHKQLELMLRQRAYWQQQFQRENIQFNRAICLLRSAYRCAQLGRGKQLLLFMGNTGVGKSSLINYLLGCKYRLDDQTDTAELVSGREYAKVGRGMTSMTIYPQVFAVTGEAYLYTDLAGFTDSRSGEIAVCSSASTEFLVRESAGVAGIVFIMDLPNFQSSKGAAFKDALKKLHKIIQGNTALLEAVHFVFTKIPSGTTTEQILRVLLVPHLNELRQRQSSGNTQDGDNELLSILEYVTQHPEKILVPDICDDGASRKIFAQRMRVQSGIFRKEGFTFTKMDALQETFVSMLVNIAKRFLLEEGDVQHAGEYLKIIAPKRRNEISQALRHNLDLLAKAQAERARVKYDKDHDDQILQEGRRLLAQHGDGPHTTHLKEQIHQLELHMIKQQAEEARINIELDAKIAEAQQCIKQQEDILKQLVEIELPKAQKTFDEGSQALQAFHNFYKLIYGVLQLLGIRDAAVKKFYEHFEVYYGRPERDAFVASIASALIYPPLEVQTVNRVTVSALETRGQDDTDDELLARAIQLSLQSQTPSYPAQGFFAGRGSIAAAAVPTMFSAQLAMPYEEQFRRATEESVRDEQLRQQIRQDEVLARQLQTELNLR